MALRFTVEQARSRMLVLAGAASLYAERGEMFWAGRMGARMSDLRWCIEWPCELCGLVARSNDDWEGCEANEVWVDDVPQLEIAENSNWYSWDHNEHGVFCPECWATMEEKEEERPKLRCL